MPNPKVRNQYFAQECKRIQNSEIQNIDDFSEIGAKTDGVSEGGVYSRVVTDADGNKVTKKYMLKAMDPSSMASEYVGANIARLYIGDSAPIVDLVRGNDGKIFVASEFIDDFETLKSLGERLQLPVECFPYGCVVDGDGELKSSAPHLQDIIDSHRPNYPKIKDAELVNIVSDYIQHGDAHDMNIGVRGKDKDVVDPTIDVKTTSLIDLSWSLRRSRAVGAEVSYNPYYSHNYDPQKTIKAIDQVLEITPQEIEQVTSPLFKNLEELYGQDNAVFRVEVSPDTPIITKGIDRIKNYIQKSLGDFGSKQTLEEVKDTMISSLEERSEALTEERKRLQDEVMFDHMWKENQEKGVDITTSDIGIEDSNPQIPSLESDNFIGGVNITNSSHVMLPQNPNLGDRPNAQLLPSSEVGQSQNLPESIIGGMAIVSTIKTLRTAFSSGNTSTKKGKKTNKKEPLKER